MCLAIPGQIENIEGDSFTRIGRIRFGAVLKDISLAFIPDAAPGDYVLAHAGVAISKLREEEAQKIFHYLEQIGEVENEVP